MHRRPARERGRGLQCSAVVSPGIAGRDGPCPFGTTGLIQEAYGPLPLFNMVPPPDAPARFGFNIIGNLVSFYARLRSGSDYGVSIDSKGIPEGLDVASRR